MHLLKINHDNPEDLQVEINYYLGSNGVIEYLCLLNNDHVFKHTFIGEWRCSRATHEWMIEDVRRKSFHDIGELEEIYRIETGGYSD